MAQEELDRVEALFLELSGGSQSISVDVTLPWWGKLDSLEMLWEILTWRIHPVGDEILPIYEGFIS